jgi:hypothetical protein
MKLYLDDWRTAPKGDGFRSADNYADFLVLLDKYRDCLEMVDLDYDLGYDSLFTGFDALKYMKRHEMKPAHINVHSTHISGRDKMLRFAEVNFPGAVITGWSSDY